VSRSLKLALAIGVSALCVWWAMREVQLAEVWAALRHADYRGFVLVMGLTLFGFWLRAFRWRWLIPTPRPLPIDSLYSATMIGFMANNLFPFRIGEFIRAWVLARHERLSKTTVFATVVVERVVDMLTLLGIFGLALLVHPISSDTDAGRLTNAGAGLLVSLSVGLTVVLILIERSPKLVGGVLERLAAKLPGGIGPRAVDGLHHFIQGLGLFRDLPRLLWVFLLSFLMFGVFAVCATVSMWALHIDVPWYAGLVMLVITAIGIMVPAAPGYIGTLNLACVAGLALFSVGKERAVPFSWFLWAGQWVPVTLVGLLYLRREGLSLAAITHAGESGEAEERQPIR
jgi:uncharacterized protein (TIRG00374 family)